MLRVRSSVKCISSFTRGVSLFMAWLFAAPLLAELPVEAIPNSLSLPTSYGDSWVFMHDGHLSSLISGKVIVLDVAAPFKQYKGDFQAAMQAGFVESKRRNELYVAETVYARTAHGKRTDLVTIYDKATLAPAAEIILPDQKRGLLSPQKGLLRLTGDERFLLVYNFTPAASVTVVDMDKRQVVNDVPIPGCTLIYPTGKRGFFTLCGNGGLASYLLDQDGQVVTEKMSDVFNDIDNDPLFMNSAVIKGIRYFPSFRGRIQPVVVSSTTAEVKKDWSLFTKDGRKENWRPSGWQLITADSAGRLYILMRRNGKDGEHDLGGSEVWVYDVVSRQRINKISLKSEGYLIEVTRGEKPYLAVVNSDLELDVYAAGSGRFIRNIGGWPTVFPVVLHAAK